MALDSYEQIAKKVLLRCPAAGILLARDWVSHAFRQVAERRRWSWLIRHSQFILPALYNTGTVAVTHNSNAVTGTGTVWTAAMVGRQFRVGLQTPIYTISAVGSGTSITLDQVWGGDTATGVTYEIYRAYVTVASDFHSLVSVWDPRFNWQLRLDTTQEELNAYDAQRANQASSAYAVVNYRYDTTSSPPLPLYEVWPHVKAQYVYPYLYEARATDLEDTGATLPRHVRGDLLLEMALASAARWPGPDGGNPYFNDKLALAHEARSERMIGEMERQDDEVYETSLTYQGIGLPFAPLPWMDADWLQSHSI